MGRPIGGGRSMVQDQSGVGHREDSIGGANWDAPIVYGPSDLRGADQRSRCASKGANTIASNFFAIGQSETCFKYCDSRWKFRWGFIIKPLKFIS